MDKKQEPPYTWPIGDENIFVWGLTLDPKFPSAPGVSTFPLNLLVEGIVQLVLWRLSQAPVTDARAEEAPPGESAA